ncbi:MAG: VOC family protein [Alphaproteobacteria bacterium]
MATSKIPEGFSTLTPGLSFDGTAAKAIDLYCKAFNAKELYRMNCPDTGRIMHACLEIGNSKIFLSDTSPKMECGPTTSTFYVYLDDVDAAYKQAVSAGLKEFSAPEDMFWGDRTGVVKDQFGNGWTLATHMRDVSPQEMEEGKKKFAAKAA